ncbi:MAG: ribonuclease P protein component [Catalinimonas sp.]
MADAPRDPAAPRLPLAREGQGRPNRSFPKEERLTGKSAVQALFQHGRAFNLYPYRVLYLPDPAPPDVPYVWPRLLVVVPKRRFRRASDRNLLKRRLREAYRLQKPAMQQLFPAGFPARLALIYVGREILPSAFLRKKLTLAVGRLSQTAHPPANFPLNT